MGGDLIQDQWSLQRKKTSGLISQLNERHKKWQQKKKGSIGRKKTESTR